MSSAEDTTLDVLVQHRAFVRSIARALLADPDAAEDVVQQTWLAAMKHAAKGGEIGRSLLARIARNFAFNRKRETRRREAREHIASVHELLPSPAEIIATEDERRRVVDAVLTLDEPFRSTVLLRYMKEHSEAEVAKELGVPLETVRWRLKTARARLRVRLADESEAPRSARALLALADWSAEEAVAALAAGKGLAVIGAKAWIGVAAGVTAVAVMGWQVVGDGSAPRTGADRDVAVVDDADRDGPHETLDATRRALDDTPDAKRDETPSAFATTPRPRSAIVVGRCVTQQDAPVVGATVSSPLAQAVAVTGADGRFALEVDTTRREGASDAVGVSVAFGAEHRTTTTRSITVMPGASVELGNVELALAGTIQGFALDEANRPLAPMIHFVAGAFATEPWWMHDPTSDANVASVRANAAGAFMIDSLEDGWYSLVPELPGYTTDHVESVGVTHGNVTSVVVRMRPAPREQRIQIVVRDDADVPMPGVDVKWTAAWESAIESGTSRRRVVTDAAGECSLVVSDTSVHTFEVQFADGRVARVSDVRGGNDRVVLRQQPAPIATITVLNDATGAPCAGVRVAFIDPTAEAASADPAEPRDGARQGLAWYDTTDAAGVARVATPPGRFMLRASHHAYEESNLGPFESGRAPVIEPIRLRPQPLLKGTVTHAGVPVADAVVVLEIAVGGMPSPQASVGEPPSAHARTESDGLFAIPVNASMRSAPSVILWAETPGLARARVELRAGELDDFAAAVAPPDGPTTRSLTLELVDGGAIEGRATTSNGRSAAGLVVTTRSEDGDLSSTRVAADGTYRLEHLRAGRWRVHLSSAEIQASRKFANTQPFAGPDVTVADRATAYQDLSWSERFAARVSGSAQFGGTARFGTLATLCSMDSATSIGDVSIERSAAIIDVNRNGEFRGGVDAPGAYVFVVQVDGEGFSLVVRRRVDLALGQNALTFDPPCGVVMGKCANPDNGSVALRATLADGSEVSIRAACASDGSFTVEFAPAGRYTVASAGKPMDIEVRTRETLTVEVK